MQTESVTAAQNYFRCQYGGEAPQAKTIRDLLGSIKNDGVLRAKSPGSPKRTKL